MKPLQGNTNQLIGDIGETLAADYLKKNNYHIIKQKWRFKHKEIDIVAENAEFIIFVEVKTRIGTETQHPLEAVTRSKQKFLIEAANEYIRLYNVKKDARFDVIAVIKIMDKYSIEHIADAFLPGL